MNGGILQAFLLLNVFLIGVASVIAFRHAYAHFWPHKHDAEHKVQQPVMKIPPAVREQMLAEAQTRYRKILDDAAGQLQLDLSKTTVVLNKELSTLGAEIINDEMKRYRESLNQLQMHTEDAIASTRDELSKHNQDLQKTMAEQQHAALARMNEEVAAEKSRLLSQIDTKLADAAASFLIETMGHDVDLGAQTPYLTKMIEQHKDDFKNEVGHEPTK
ncbi:MAG: hypothetical protein ABIR46_04540 [Candidatus Saccharimonadales bacterium]